MSKLTCLYCFEKFNKNEIQFRCINPNPSLCSPIKDELLGKYLGLKIPPTRAKVVRAKPTPGLPLEAQCSCGMISTKAICPLCHNDLPHQFGMTENYIIALIGVKNVGKSHYIAVLIHELMNRIGAHFNAALIALDEQTIKRYNNDFKRYIYDEGEQIPGTISAQADMKVRYPLVYRLSIKKKGFYIGSAYNVVSLVFFDTAGEDLHNIDIMSNVTRYIANANGIIFLLDPLQIQAVREKMPPAFPLPEKDVDQNQLIGRVTQLIQTIRKLKPDSKINIPIAVTFSKIDALKKVIDPVLLKASKHYGYLDLTDVIFVHEILCSQINQWLGANMLNHISQTYKHFSFFGASALGYNPDKSGKLKKGINPYRIEDPLLWILYKKGLIKGKKI